MEEEYMDIFIKSVTENYRDRVQRLALFEVLYKLDNKKTKDNSGNNIDYFGLGLLTLLFFFENMLRRNKKAGIKELTSFLLKINRGKIDLEEKDFEKLARSIIEVFRPTTGKKNSRKFYNWELDKEEEVQYSILKASRADIKANTQYYTLDEQGLELIFASKEYFSEFQLSINQLLLRRQLEKGEFSSALRQVDEMKIDVENLEERIIRIKHEIQRNILSESTYERYKELVDDINNRLNRENAEFEELQNFVTSSRHKAEFEIKEDKDRKSFEYLIKIQKELSKVHAQHRQLLEKSIELKNATLQTAYESLYYVGVESFNFNKEIVSNIFSAPLPLEATRRIVEPLLYLHRFEGWSPLAVFSSQRLERRGGEVRETIFLDMAKENQVDIEIDILRKNFKYVMELCIKYIEDRNSITLMEFVDRLKENDMHNILEDMTFYHFFIILHQKTPIIFTEEEDNELLLLDVIETLKTKYKSIEVLETNGVVQANERFSIKNMTIKLEEKKYAI